MWTTFRTSEKTQNSVWSKLKSKKWQKQMPWVNGSKATQKPLAFIFSAKENDFMSRKGRTNGSIKKIIEGQTAEQTLHEHKASRLLPRNIVLERRDLANDITGPLLVISEGAVKNG